MRNTRDDMIEFLAVRKPVHRLYSRFRFLNPLKCDIPVFSASSNETTILYWNETSVIFSFDCLLSSRFLWLSDMSHRYNFGSTNDHKCLVLLRCDNYIEGVSYYAKLVFFSGLHIVSCISYFYRLPMPLETIITYTVKVNKF